MPAPRIPALMARKGSNELNVVGLRRSLSNIETGVLAELASTVARLATSDALVLDDDPPEVVQHQHRLKSEEVKLPITRYEEGATTYQLAKEFHCHRTTVSVHLDRGGVVKRTKGMAEAEIDEAVSDYERGHSLATVGLRFGFHASTIQAALRQRGIRIRDPHWRER